MHKSLTFRRTKANKFSGAPESRPHPIGDGDTGLSPYADPIPVGTFRASIRVPSARDVKISYSMVDLFICFVGLNITKY